MRVGPAGASIGGVGVDVRLETLGTCGVYGWAKSVGADPDLFIPLILAGCSTDCDGPGPRSGKHHRGSKRDC